METSLIFHAGFDLPLFASFVLLEDESGRRALREYLDRFVRIAREHDVGLVLDTPTWRASADWGAQLGYTAEALADVNRNGVAFVERVRADAGDGMTIVLSGAIGPRRDAYLADDRMSADEAEGYHHAQLATLADTSVDLATAYKLTNASEAIGIVRAAKRVGLSVAIAFTVETDGRVPGWAAATRGDRRGRRGHRPRRGVLPDQLRPPEPLRKRPPHARRDGRADPRPARQRVGQEPRRARRVGNAGRRRPGGARSGLRLDTTLAAEPERRRRLLRHRPPARRRDLRDVDRSHHELSSEARSLWVTVRLADASAKRPSPAIVTR